MTQLASPESISDQVRTYLESLKLQGEKRPTNRVIARELHIGPDPKIGRVKVASAISYLRQQSGERPDKEETSRLRKEAISETRGRRRLSLKVPADMGEAGPEAEVYLRRKGIIYPTKLLGATLSKGRKSGDYRQLTEEEKQDIRQTVNKHVLRETIQGRARMWAYLAEDLLKKGQEPPKID